MSASQPYSVGAEEPACRSGEGAVILLLEDGEAEAELFCHALVLAWQMLESKPEVPRPDIAVRRTAQDALDDLRKRVVSEARGFSDFVELDLNFLVRVGLTFLWESWNDPGLRNPPVVAMAWADDQAAIAQTLDGPGVLDYDYAVKLMRFAELVTMVGCFCRQIFPHTPGQALSAAMKGDHFC